MSNFEPNAILRGAQLTVVGALRALKNPSLFKYEHFRQAAIAVCAGIAIRMIVALPILLIKFVIWILSWVSDLEYATWDDNVIHGLDFLSSSVLQLPFLLMTLTRYITPTLDDMFMDSLKWVDTTYMQKHQSENVENLRAMYYPNLVLYQKRSTDITKGVLAFLKRYGRRTAMSLAIYLLSMLPLVGRFVLPAASFYTFNKAVGPVPAVAIFGSGLFLPKRLLVVFLQSYFSSRSLMRELLEPYFSRIQFNKEQKRRWFLDREGVLFGFAFGFYFILRTPLLGVLLYGVAEASTAYLLTKITDPPPPPAYSEGFAESQVAWKNKHEFLKLPISSMDLHNVDMHSAVEKLKERKDLPQKQFI